jgi:nucleoside-diphosphate kinase
VVPLRDSHGNGAAPPWSNTRLIQDLPHCQSIGNTLKYKAKFFLARCFCGLVFIWTQYAEILMALERTLSIIKPDAVAKNIIGEIYRIFEAGGLKIIAAKMMHLSREQAEAFYVVHKQRPFYNDLVKFMTSGPVMVQVLEGTNAVAKNRELMGATNPAQAAAGTIRAQFAGNVEENAVHGSDGPDTAKTEIEFFFTLDEICPRTR